MKNEFIIRYRLALRELQEAYRLQYSLPDESDELRILAHQQEDVLVKAILKNRKTGLGILINWLRECLDAQTNAWTVTQHLKQQIEEMEANGYDSEVTNDQNRNLYYVIEDAISILLDVFGSQFPKKITGVGIATERQTIPVSELVLKYGSRQLQRRVKQLIADNKQHASPSNNVTAQTKPEASSPVPSTSKHAESAIEIHAHYSKMFEAFTVLPPSDISSALFEKACELWAESSWNDFGAFLRRLEAYWEASKLSSDRHEKIGAFLAKQKLHFGRGIWMAEERPRINETDELDLKHRRESLEASIAFPERDVTPLYYAPNYTPSIGDVFMGFDPEQLASEIRSPVWTTPAWESIEARRESLSQSLQKVEEKLGILAKRRDSSQAKEQTIEAKQPKKLNQEEQTVLLADIQRHFPGILFGPFVPYPPELVLPSLACHLGELWSPPRQHSAPSDYDEAYYNQSPAGRAEFLAALRRLYDSITKELHGDFTGNYLFSTLSWKETQESPNQSREAMHTLATRGAARLGNWLNWREQTAVEQLLNALGTIEISDADLSMTDVGAQGPPRLYIPDCAPATEAKRFAALLREFKRGLPSKKSKLRVVMSQLERLRALSPKPLSQAVFGDLPSLFPDVEWLLLAKRPADSITAETFWPDLTLALQTRVHWAKEAYSVIKTALGEVGVVEEKPIIPQEPLEIATPTIVTAGMLLRNRNEIQPIAKQFFKLKPENPLAALIFLYEDSYLAFNEDAKTISQVLNTELVGESLREHEITYLTLFPAREFDSALSKLVRSGIRIAVCEKQLPLPGQKDKQEVTTPPFMPLLHYSPDYKPAWAANGQSEGDAEQQKNNLVERDGRYFVQCSDGELETTLEMINFQAENLKHLEKHTQTWTRLFGHQKWALKDVPRDAEVYVRHSHLFEELIKLFQKSYDAGESLWTSYKMCDMAIAQTELRLSNPYGNQAIDNSMLTVWQSARKVLDTFPKRGKLDEEPTPEVFTAASVDVTDDSIDANPNGKLDINESGPLAPFTSTTFTWIEADKLAEAVGLIQGGLYKLGPQKKAAFTGFIEALKEWELIEQKTLPELHKVFGLYYRQVIKTDRINQTRTDFRVATLKKLATLFPLLRPNPTNKPRI